MSRGSGGKRVTAHVQGDGRRFIVELRTDTIRVLDADTGLALATPGDMSLLTLRHKSGSRSALDAKKMLAVGWFAYAGRYLLWKPATGEVASIASLSSIRAWTELHHTVLGHVYATADANGRLALWRGDDGEQIASLEIGKTVSRILPIGDGLIVAGPAVLVGVTVR